MNRSSQTHLPVHCMYEALDVVPEALRLSAGQLGCFPHFLKYLVLQTLKLQRQVVDVQLHGGLPAGWLVATVTGRRTEGCLSVCVITCKSRMYFTTFEMSVTSIGLKVDQG